jgi:hypothetical protein
MHYEHLMARVGEHVPQPAAGVDRRSFLKLGAASGASRPTASSRWWSTGSISARA